MSDETLIGDEIAQAAHEGLLQPFDPDQIRGASYEIRAGRTIIIAYSQSEGGISPIDLEVRKSWSIPPGHTATLYSLEILSIPDDMQVRLSLRARLAARLLVFAGGLVDPGYKGYLFLPIANLSQTPVDISYGEPVVVAEFVRLSKSAHPYSAKPVTSIPANRLPPVPPDPVHDLGELTRITRDHDRRITRLGNTLADHQPLLQANTRMIDTFMAAVAAGVGAGAAIAAILGLFTLVPQPWNWVGGGLAMAAALGSAFLLRRTVTFGSSGTQA